MARRNAICKKARQPHDSQMLPSVRFSRHHDCRPDFLLGESVPAPEPFNLTQEPAAPEVQGEMIFT